MTGKTKPAGAGGRIMPSLCRVGPFMAGMKVTSEAKEPSPCLARHGDGSFASDYLSPMVMVAALASQTAVCRKAPATQATGRKVRPALISGTASMGVGIPLTHIL